MAYIMINDEVFVVDTDEQVEEAKLVLLSEGIDSADVHVGEPDGLGDSYKNGSKVFAAVNR